MATRSLIGGMKRVVGSQAEITIGARASVRFFSDDKGKVLSEEERAKENVYIKKMEQEKLEKAARKGPTGAEQNPSAAASGASVHETSTEGFSTDKNRNYGVIAGTVAFAGAVGWYLLSKPNKSKEEVSD